MMQTCSSERFIIKYFYSLKSKNGEVEYIYEFNPNELYERPHIEHYKVFYNKQGNIMKVEDYNQVHIHDSLYIEYECFNNCDEEDLKESEKNKKYIIRSDQKEIKKIVENLRIRKPNGIHYYRYDNNGKLMKIDTIVPDIE